MEIQEIYSHFQACSGVFTDTRTPLDQGMFFGLNGPHFKGSEYGNKALELGATYAVVERGYCEPTEGIIEVSDVLQTLQQLAHVHRKQFQFPVLGITGTNGKTTSKEILKSILSEEFSVHATLGNLNNHIGVPLTLLNTPKNTNFAIIEMGANKPGDIRELCEIAAPNYGVITNVGFAHLEGFGSFEKLIQTKRELYDYIEQTGGIAFQNSEFEELNTTHVASFSSSHADKLQLKPTKSFPHIQFEIGNGRQLPVKTQLTGMYNLPNFALGVTVGLHFKLTLEQIVRGIEAYCPTNNRSQVLQDDHRTLIMDAYNANPTSVKAALENLQTSAQHGFTKPIALLGEMRELGDDSDALHTDILDMITEQKIQAFCFGPSFVQAKQPSHNVTCFPTITDLPLESKTEISAGDLILVKGSRGIQMEKLAKDLFPSLLG